jgi:hypothetical protein
VWIVIGILLAFFCVFAVVTRYAVSFPRFGRWLDARIYRAFPRVGHLFVSDAESETKDGT